MAAGKKVIMVYNRLAAPSCTWQNKDGKLNLKDYKEEEIKEKALL